MASMLQFDISKLPGNPLRAVWDRIGNLPGGKAVFSKVVGETAPYSGTIGAQVEELREGRAVLTLKQRRKVTNHLNSIHAVALMNLGEMCSGACLMYSIPGDMRGIVSAMDMKYLKKARGTLTAICEEAPIEHANEPYRRTVQANIYDEAGDLCAVFSAEWDLKPKLTR